MRDGEAILVVPLLGVLIIAASALIPTPSISQADPVKPAVTNKQPSAAQQTMVDAFWSGLVIGYRVRECGGTLNDIEAMAGFFRTNNIKGAAQWLDANCK